MLTDNQYPFQIVFKSFGEKSADLARITVAIPARNEQDVILPCLKALMSQSGVDLTTVKIVFLLNNCTDDTFEAIQSQHYYMPFQVVVGQVNLPKCYQNAGWARKLSMDYANALTLPDGYILSTDADSVADKDWIANKQIEFEKGADAVAGFVTADWEELKKMPENVLKLGALEWEYQGLSAELEAKADLEPHDQWQRHNQNCGASLGITAKLYDDIGGLPPLHVGEDRALFDAVRDRDGKIRHSLEAHVTASARMVGRASGGMADALKTRGSEAYLCDDILEPADNLLFRNLKRNEARKAWKLGDISHWVFKEGFDTDLTKFESFGLAWKHLEQTQRRLARKRLRSSDLEAELIKIKHHISKLNVMASA
jgi:glycosyltransferase involved in cell wall biosynthesis